MQTFRISKVQEQSYYAIRIFGIVHLSAAIGLVVLLDGPSNGLRGVSWFLIAAMIASSAYLLLRVIQARAGRIDGHYVLTRKTLAIMLPGQPRRFMRKRDCTGFLPGRSALVFRGANYLSLRSASSKPYCRELVDCVCRAWWPGLHGTSLWKGLMEGDPEGTLDLKVDFRGRPDGREPLLVYTAGKSHGLWQCLGLVVCPMLAAGFVLLIFQKWNETTLPFFPEVPVVWQLFSVTASAAGIVASLVATVYIARQVFFHESSRQAFVISTRSMAVLQRGHQTVFRHANELVHTNPQFGELYFRDGATVLAGPYRYGGPYNGMLRTLFSSWRFGRILIPAHAFATGSNTILGNLIAWFGFSIWLDGALSPLQWFMLIYFWLDFRRRASERIDVSPSHSDTPTVSEASKFGMIG